MKKLSIGLRLTLWYFVIFAVAQGAFGLAMWVLVRHSMYDVVEDSLQSPIGLPVSLWQHPLREPAVAP